MSMSEQAPLSSSLAIHYLSKAIEIAQVTPVESFRMTRVGASVISLTHDETHSLQSPPLLAGERLPYLYHHRTLVSAEALTDPPALSPVTLGHLSGLVARCNFPLDRITADARLQRGKCQTTLAVIADCDRSSHHQITDFMTAFGCKPTLSDAFDGPLYDLTLPDGHVVTARPWPPVELFRY